MKNIYSIVTLLLLATSVWAQSIEIASTTHGFLPPRMTNDQRDAITSPAVGLTIYNTTVNSLQWWNGTLWYNSATGATGPQGPAGPTGPAGNGFTNGTVNNQIMYWNGSAWVTLNPGLNGQTLNLINGSLRWVTPPVVYPVGSVFCAGGATLVFDVTNPITNKTWMDRNLGAKQVSTNNFSDYNGNGDLYQWGRRSDGHQCRNSRDTLTLSSLDQPAHGLYISPNDSPYDWRSPQNTNLWQGINGINNPCPSGYRLPTETELNQERLSWTNNTPTGAFASVLKLPSAGYRPNNFFPFNMSGFYWSSTINGTFSRALHFYCYYDKRLLTTICGADIRDSNRRSAFSVRCIKD